MPRVEGSGAIEKEGYDPIPYFVVDLQTKDVDFDPAEFDRLARKIGSFSYTTFQYQDGQCVNSRSYNEGDLNDPQNEVIAKSYLHFIVVGEKMYIFPENITHHLFLNQIKGDDPDDAGSLLLQWKVGWGDSALVVGESVNRTVFGYPSTMEVDPYGEFRPTINTLLEKYFVFD